MEAIEFTKMQGCGNDYVYINCLQSYPANPANLAKKISDRHFGVGSDGLVLICPSETADFRMQMFNSDGSEAEMCGNAVRCIAKYVYEKNLTRKTVITLETKAGIKTLFLNIKDSQVLSTKVDMGIPELIPQLIPVNLQAGRIINYSQEFSGKEFKINCVSVGNPHCVIFVPEINDELVNFWGPKIENAAIFPKRINVEFVKIISDTEVNMRVWERGAGETLACGTGAAAVCVAANLNNLTDRKIKVNLTGGSLELEWAENNHIYKTGPAEFVFSGVYKY